MDLWVLPTKLFIPYPMDLHHPIPYPHMSLWYFQTVWLQRRRNTSLINHAWGFLSHLKFSSVKYIVAKLVLCPLDYEIPSQFTNHKASSLDLAKTEKMLSSISGKTQKVPSWYGTGGFFLGNFKGIIRPMFWRLKWGYHRRYKNNWSGKRLWWEEENWM